MARRDEYDITNPPPGKVAVACVAQCEEGIVAVPRGIVGPVRGTQLRPWETSTVMGPGRCTACSGRGWMWGWIGGGAAS